MQTARTSLMINENPNSTRFPKTFQYGMTDHAAPHNNVGQQNILLNLCGSALANRFTHAPPPVYFKDDNRLALFRMINYSSNDVDNVDGKKLYRPCEGAACFALFHSICLAVRDHSCDTLLPVA